jgi:hypothetical protein
MKFINSQIFKINHIRIVSSKRPMEIIRRFFAINIISTLVFFEI